MRRFYSAILLLTTVGYSVGNDGWWSAAGGAGAFGKNHPQIKMVSEHVQIEMRDDDAGRVTVDFLFRNEGPSTRVTMAFPEEYGGPMDIGLERFRSWIDGAPVRCTRKVIDSNKQDRMWKAVWLKEVSFRANSVRRVRVSYIAPYSGNTVGDRSLTYILRTGATWKSTIDEIKISVDWTKMRALSKPEFGLAGARWRAVGPRRREAILRKVEPRSDLSLEMIGGFWNFSIDGNRVSQYATGGSGRRITSDPAQALINIKDIGAFFGAWTKVGKGREADWQWWAVPAVQVFGGPFEVVERNLKFETGRVLQLPAKPLTLTPTGWNKPARYIYLRDLIRTLGGKYVWVQEDQRIDISFDRPGKRS